ncbi:hypothetical protein EON83_20235 [bacterium]|nr:MAG: hypothetical protein EON83_20235 [bacterium]
MPTKGESIYSKLLLQLVREETPGVYDPNGRRTVMLQVKGDFVPEEQWGNFRPDGFNVDAWNALSKEHRVFNGTLQPDFSHIELLAEMACGVSFLTTTAPTTDTVQNVYEVPSMGERSIYTYTLERGTPSSCERCTYGILIAMSGTNDRDAATPEGSITLLCRKPELGSADVPMTGGVAQSAVLRFTATGVAAPGVFAVKIGSAAAQNVSLAAGDTTANTVTKLAAVGVTATVVGTVATATGEVHRLYNPSATGNAVFYGGAITLNPNTSTTTSLQTAIQALGGDFAARTVAGTITPPTIGAPFSMAGSTDDALYNGTYTNAGNYNSAPYYTNANGRVCYLWSGTTWYFTSALGSPAFVSAAGNATNPTAATAGGTGPAVPTITYTSSPGFVDITITTPSGAGNVADIESNPGTGYVGTSTPPGGSSGVITATVTAPTNTPVSVTFVSGTGWSGLQSQVGGDGKFRIPKRLPMMPQMFTYRESDTRAGLDTAQAIGKVKKVGWTMDSIAGMEWFFDENNLGPQSHTDNADAKQSLTVQLAKSSNGLARLQADATVQPSAPRWREIRAAHPDLKHLFRFQLNGSTMAAAPLQAAGNIQSYEFSIGAVLTDTPGVDNSTAITVRRLA